MTTSSDNIGAEWQIMKVLWRKSPITSSEIIEILRPGTKWNSKTIHTLISRLVKKGVVEAKREGNFYHYSALVSEEECRMIETKSFIEKVYDGSLLSPLIGLDNLRTFS